MTVQFHVFPTCVGVNRFIPLTCTPGGRLPHVRGGEPLWAEFLSEYTESSPRAWG